MKKFFVVFMLMFASLMFCSCGGKNLIHMNETVQCGRWELTVTDIDYEEEFVLGSSMYRPGNGKTYLCVEYKLKNIGKDEVYFSPGEFKGKIYYDGYEFEADRNFRLSSVGWVNNGEEIPPLSNEFFCRDYFQIPLEVKESTEIPLQFKLNLDKELTCNIRPIDEMQKEGLYNKALQQLDEGEITDSIEKFELLSGYKDADTQLEDAKLCDRFNHCEQNLTYFEENQEKYVRLSGDEIKSLLVAHPWRLVKRSGACTFLEDGTVKDEAYPVNYLWRVEGDELVLENYVQDGVTSRGEVRRVYKDRYIFYTEDPTHGLHSSIYGENYILGTMQPIR